jgi:spermidine synthase
LVPGTIAAYGRPGDFFDFYEINPQVNCLATSVFTYLPAAREKCEITAGDARLALERQVPQQFDLIALDAFNSDSIPVHLLTREAFQTYLRHLKPNGVLAIHTSNHFLNLDPVVTGLAREFGLLCAVVDHDAKPEQWWNLLLNLGSALAQFDFF